MRRLIHTLVSLAAEVAPIVVVAWVTFHLIRGQLLERYIVPSGSMEPTLHGHPDRGDVVLVDKTAFWGGAQPARFSLVVLSDPHDLERDHLVKRVVSTGGDSAEYLWIERGDLFVGDSEADLFAKIAADQPLAKDPELHADMRLTHFEYPRSGPEQLAKYLRRDDAWRRDDRGIVLRPAFADADAARAALAGAARLRRNGDGRTHLRGHLATFAPITAQFVDHEGVRRGQPAMSRDNGIEVELRPDASCTALQFVFEYRGVHYSLTYFRAGRAQLYRNGVTRGAAVSVPAFAGAGALNAAFGYLDGKLFLLVDGRRHLWVRERLVDGQTGTPPGARGMDNRLHVAAIGGPARIQRLRFFHDVWYDSPRAPFGKPRPDRVEVGQIYVLGDNTFDSRDSRARLHFDHDSLVGRPLAVIAPAGRARWLIR